MGASIWTLEIGTVCSHSETSQIRFQKTALVISVNGTSTISAGIDNVWLYTVLYAGNIG